jgi:hypothetical protein
MTLSKADLLPEWDLAQLETEVLDAVQDMDVE